MALREQLPTAAAFPHVTRREKGATPHDYLYCRQVMRRASRNYSFAAAFLPPEKRKYEEALYALLRVGDDRVDVSHQGFAHPLAAIEDWEQTYYQAFERGVSAHPVMRAYLDTAQRFSIPVDTMEAYFRAMREDLTITRFPTFADLMHYMKGSAIPVGRAMTHILGVRPGRSLDQVLAHADSLSVAMQLSNFWRDIGQDWGIGRVYIPLEDLERFGLTELDLALKRHSPRFERLLDYQIERAERYYEHARSGIRYLASGRWGVMAGLEIYRAILRGIRRNRYDVFSRRAGSGAGRMAALVLKSRWLTWFL